MSLSLLMRLSFLVNFVIFLLSSELLTEILSVYLNFFFYFIFSGFAYILDPPPKLNSK